MGDTDCVALTIDLFTANESVRVMLKNQLKSKRVRIGFGSRTPMRKQPFKIRFRCENCMWFRCYRSCSSIVLRCVALSIRLVFLHWCNSVLFVVSHRLVDRPEKKVYTCTCGQLLHFICHATRCDYENNGSAIDSKMTKQCMLQQCLAFNSFLFSRKTKPIYNMNKEKDKHRRRYRWERETKRTKINIFINCSSTNTTEAFKFYYH